MKQFLYLLTFAASVGTVGVVATNPQLVQQGASFLGVSSPGSNAVHEPEDDHLARFLSQYPYANKEDAAPKQTETPPVDSPEPKPSIASKTPALPPVPPAPPLPPPSTPKAPDPEPVKEAPKEVAKKPEPPKAPDPEPVKEPPKDVAKKPEPPKAPDPEPVKEAPKEVAKKPDLPPTPPLVTPPLPKTEPKIEPKTEPKEELAKQPESAKEDKSKAPPLPIIAPVVISKKEVEKAPVAEPIAAKPIAQEPVAKEPIAPPPVKEPIAAPFADPFSTAQTSPVPSFDGPTQDSIGVAMTPKTEPGLVPLQGPSVYESGNLEKPIAPAKPEPTPMVAATAPPIQPTPQAQPPAPPIAAAPIPHEKPMTPMAPPTTAPDPFLANQTNEPPSVHSFGNPYGQPNFRPEPGGFAQTPPVPPSMSPAMPPNTTAVPPQTGMQAPQPTVNPALAAFQGLPPQAQPQPAQPKASSQFQVSPSVVAEEVPCHGSEIVARVGREVILMCDILPQLRRAGIRVINDQLKKMPPEERAQVPKQELEHAIDQIVESQYPNFLQEQIQVALVYNDFYVAKSKEDRESFEKKMGEEFDSKEIPEMIKEFGVRDMAELKQFLNDQLGSSIDKERRLWVRTLIAQQWIHFSVQGATGECTHDEMMEFYTENRERFTSKAKVQWQEMFVAFSNHKTEQDAYMKIAWMGNQVAAGFPLEDIAKKNSDGFTASKGGLWDWTFRGSLTSEELENAIFTQPVGVLSPKIIRSEKGFHLVRTVKREEARTTPFIDAQVIIRDKIRQQRRQKFEHEYFDELNRRYPTIVLKEKIDFDLNRRTASVFGGAH